MGTQRRLDGEAERAAAHGPLRPAAEVYGRNGAERFIFERYCARYRTHGFDIPALIPQVYLHYDPYTRRAGGTLPRQRMDFLLLLPPPPGRAGARRHPALRRRRGPRQPGRYAEMVAADRELQLAGYEVYRFGGHEIADRSHAPASLIASSTPCSQT